MLDVATAIEDLTRLLQETATVYGENAPLTIHAAKTAIGELVKPESVIHATVDFVDIAGLVKGASRGEGLGNKFLGNIRETHAIAHVVRCFENDDVVHVSGDVDPIRPQLLQQRLRPRSERIPQGEARHPAFAIR